MTVYLDRSAWTSTAASGATLTGDELVGVAYHWPGTTAAIIGVQTQAATAQRLREYRNFHVTGRGWRDIGYNFAFDQAGRVWMLRSTTWGGNLVGAHCASTTNPRANHKYVGCLLILGADEAPSAAMLAAINDWYWTRFLPRWPGRTDNRGHGQVPGASTSCQGSAVRAALAAGTIPGSEGEDDMPLDATDLAKIKTTVMQALATKAPYISPGVAAWAKRNGVAPTLSMRLLAEYTWLQTNALAAEPGPQTARLLAGQAGILAAVAAIAADPAITEARMVEIVNDAIKDAVVDVNVTVTDDVPPA